MTYKEARALAREIAAADGCWCGVPRGHGPDGYVARIVVCRIGGPYPARPVDFASRDEWRAWRVEWDAETERRRVALERASRPRSPLDVLIDRACGLG